MSHPFTERAPFFIVMNRGSGRGDAAAVEQQLRRALAADGREHELLIADEPGRIEALAGRAVELARHHRGVVAVAGGDGTINAVVQAVLPSEVPFAVLPQGTFNFFGRCHGLPLPGGDAGEALAQLFGAREKPVQAGLVNGRAFLVNASLGMYPELLEQREAHKQRFGRHRLVALGSGLLILLDRHPRLRLQLSHDGQERWLPTTTLVVGNNRLQLEQIGIDQAPEVERGRLVAIAAKPVGRLHLLAMAARGLLGQLGDHDHVESFSFAELEVRRGRSRRAKLALDGEIFLTRFPLRFTVAERPLRLLVPRETAS